ncbi:MAG: hypothetical protein HQL94_04910 [Magnetococcales bacterium]|nr:hypothetical protein [Magnetococcales bacterium]
MSAPIQVDGELGDWVAQDREQALLLPLTDSEWLQDEASSGESEPDGQMVMRLWAAYHGDRFYLAAQWSDATQNATYKPWKLTNGEYVRARTVDDMFVVRLQLGESFSQCMLTNSAYQTDIWRWSAGRSNLAGLADDMKHAYSSKPFDTPAREYEGKNGIVYFLSTYDPGVSGWQNVPRPKGVATVVPSVAKSGESSGSRVDVTAVGQWRDGVWTLEMSRKMNTGDPEDVVFKVGGEQVAQFAVFNAGYQWRKYITNPVLLKFADR